MRIVFFGTPATAVPSFDALADSGHELVLAVTQPDRPSGRSKTPRFSPVKQAALAAGIEVTQPAKVRSRTFRESIAALRPELLVVVAYGRILGQRLLDAPPRGAVNVHFSLLPKYRGAAPVQWALARGERVTGVTTMRMNSRMDEGDTLLRREVAIEPDEHAPELQERLSAVGAALLVETVDRLAAGDLAAVPQDHDAATLAPILTKADGEIGLDLDAPTIEGRVRGFDPWPGVWLAQGGTRIRLLAARALAGFDDREAPGTLVDAAEGPVLICAHGTRLLLQRVQAEGRKPLEVRDAINGRQIRPGERFESLAQDS